METYKKIIFIGIIIALIVGIIYYEVAQERTSQETSTNSIDDPFEIYLENNTTTQENTEEDLENNATENIIGEENTSQNVEVTGTDEEKALALAKNQWGASDTEVYFTVANQNGNIYYISVNNSETTEVLAWYEVNIENGEVSDY